MIFKNVLTISIDICKKITIKTKQILISKLFMKMIIILKMDKHKY